MGSGAPPRGVDPSFSSAPDQIAIESPVDHEERRINPIDAAVIAQEFARIIGMGTPDQLAAGNIQPAASPDRLAADDEPPPAPPGGYTVRFSLSHLWHTLGTAWSEASGRSPRRDLMRLYAMADRIDEETGGFGQYWVARAILDADDVAIRTPDSGPRHGVAYIDGIIQRWKREDNWGSPHPDMGEDRPRGGSHETNEQTKPNEEVLSHPANRIYQEVTGITPTAEQAELICDAFSEGVPPQIQTEWRTALKEWMAGVTREGQSYNPRNVPSILNFYHKKQRHSGAGTNLTDKVSPTPFADAEREGLVTNPERFSWEHINFANARTAADKRRVLAEFDAWLEPRRQEKAERLAAAAEATHAPTHEPAAADEPEAADAPTDEPAADKPAAADEPPGGAEWADEATGEPAAAHAPTGEPEVADAPEAADTPTEDEAEPAGDTNEIAELRQLWETVKDTFDPWSGTDLGPPMEYKGVMYQSMFHAATAQMLDEREQAAIEARYEERLAELDEQVHEREHEIREQEALEMCEQLEQAMTIEEMRTLLEKGRREDEQYRLIMQQAKLRGTLRGAFRQIADRRSGNPGGSGFLSSELAPLAEADPEPPMPEGGWPIDDRSIYWRAGAKRKWGDSQYFTREELLAYAAEHPQHPEHPEEKIRALGYDPERPLIEQGIDVDIPLDMDYEADKYMWELMERYHIAGMPPSREMRAYRMKEQQWQTMVEQQERVEA